MKLAAQVMMLAATAGLAVIALTTRKPAEEDSRESEARPPAHATVDSDAWFV